FNKLAEGSLPILESQIYDMKFPDIEVPVDLGITEVDLTISDMAMTELNVGGLSIGNDVVSEPPRVNIELDDTSLALSFSWSYKETTFPFISDHGTGTVTVDGVSGSMSSTVGVSPDTAMMYAAFVSFAFDLGDITIDLDGGASALYGLVLNAFLTV
ncbi:hypothetical protein KIPB_015559, partial [Kipferlia bialata]